MKFVTAIRGRGYKESFGIVPMDLIPEGPEGRSGFLFERCGISFGWGIGRKACPGVTVVVAVSHMSALEGEMVDCLNLPQELWL